MANRIVSSTQVGAKYIVTFDHDGPASYANAGGFITHGEIINAADIGMGGFEFIDSGDLSTDALHTVLGLLPSQSSSTDPVNMPAPASPTFRLMWFVQATGAEVANAVNLSTKTVRLKATCV